MAVLGNVDAGKTTLTAMFVGKAVDSLDSDEYESARGKTMECSTETLCDGEATITIVDAPGHLRRVSEAIAGMAGVDVVLLVVSARCGELEAGLSGGQTVGHMQLAKAAGVQAVVVAVNKLDAVEAAAVAAATGHGDAGSAEVAAEVAAEVEARYRECVEKVGEALVRCGFNPRNPETVRFIPVCGLQGHNLVEGFPAGACPWWKGRTLVQEITSLRPKPRDGALRAIVTSTGAEDSVVIVRGALTVGQRVAVTPGRRSGVVAKIFVDGEEAAVAEAGSRAAVVFRGAKLGPDDVLAPAVAPCGEAQQVCAMLKVLPGDCLVTAGLKDLVVQVGCGAHLAEVVQYVGPLDAVMKVVRGADGKAARNPHRPGLTAADKFGGAVILRLEKPAAFDLEVPALSRLVVRSGDTTIAIGRVHKLL